jgi:periplasmic divalent cation tolerance protein
MILIYSTFGNKKGTERIGERLVQKKLAACVNIFPISSIYRWQGKIVKDKEFAMIIKTKKTNFRMIERFISENHGYKTPCVIEIPIARAARKYLEWLNPSC